MILAAQKTAVMGQSWNAFVQGWHRRLEVLEAMEKMIQDSREAV
jgi:hypothetical protein